MWKYSTKHLSVNDNECCIIINLALIPGRVMKYSLQDIYGIVLFINVTKTFIYLSIL